MSIEIYGKPKLQNPYLVVAWDHDAANLGPKVIDYLRAATGAQEFGEIEPLGFFPLVGVAIDDDIIQFPSCKFFASESKNLILLGSMQPQQKPYQFLSLIVDVAQRFGVREIYTVGGLAFAVAHTSERRAFAIVNKPELGRELEGFGVDMGMNYQGSASITSFMLWVARSRGVSSATIWGQIPFYLAAVADPRAEKTMLELLMRRFGLGFDLTGLDQEIENQERQIDRLRLDYPEVDSYIGRLERGDQLTREEGQRLVTEVGELLSKRIDS